MWQRTSDPMPFKAQFVGCGEQVAVQVTGMDRMMACCLFSALNLKQVYLGTRN
jgi:hypothetical protein